MAVTKLFAINEDISLEHIVASIIRFLSEDKKMVSEVILQPNGIILQSKSKEQLKSLVGMSLATQIQFESCNDKLCVNIGSGKWIDKAVVAGVGFLTPIGAVTLATSAFGAWQQKKLPDEISCKIQNIIQNGNCVASKEDYNTVFRGVSGDEIYVYAVKLVNEKQKIELLKLAAENNSCKAAMELGNLYYEGQRISKDLYKAVKYWERCSKHLDKDISLKLADMYRDGDGIEKDLKKAFQFYQNVSKDNFSQRIIEIYEQGTDLPEYLKAVALIYEERFDAGEKQILDKIIEIYTKLNDNENLQKWQIVKAKNGDVDIALSLGKKLYEDGKKESVELLTIAAPQEDPVALRMLGEAYWNGDLVQEDDEKAIPLLQKAAQKGSLNAAEILVIHYDEYEKDDIKLLQAIEQEVALFESGKYVDKSEEFVLADELYDLAWLYCSGGEDGKITINIPKGISLFEKAIELGDTDSYLSLAEIYSEEEYKTVDYDKAIKYCQKAVEANVEDAEELLQELQEIKNAPLYKAEFEYTKSHYKEDKTGNLTVKLANMYAVGRGTDIDTESAMDLYHEAYELGNAEAAYHLGQEKDLGNFSISKALELYEFSVEHGFAPAQKALDLLQYKIKRFYNRLVGPYLEQSERIISNETDLSELSLEERTCYLEYFIPFSCEAAEIFYEEKKKPLARTPYYSRMHIDHNGNINFLSLAFLEAYHQTKDPEATNHFFKKLIRLGVYWPLVLLSNKLQVEAEEEDNDEKISASMLCLHICAKHGCIEAITLERTLIKVPNFELAISNIESNYHQNNEFEMALRSGRICFFE